MSYDTIAGAASDDGGMAGPGMAGPGMAGPGMAGPGTSDGRALRLRPMRADAARNRALILEAAEEIFASGGVTAGVDDVARRAGVGVGTLYRHFPTKEALFEAIVNTRLERLLQLAEDRARADDPAEALFGFLRELAAEAAAKRDLIAGLGLAGFDAKAHCAEMFDQMIRSIDVLLQRAAQAGAVRDDVPAAEVVGLLAGTCHARPVSGPGDAGLQRIVGVVIDGLARRVPAQTPVSP